MTQLVWLVTGCSSGFGRCYVKSILARGDKVIATARRAHERLGDLQEAGVAILDLDVTASVEEIQKVASKALEIYGSIDVLVNNAGYIELGTVEEIPAEKMLHRISTNILGPLNLTRRLLPHFRQRPNGIILFMSSIGAYTLQGNSGGGTYLGRAKVQWNEEIAPFGIRCCLVTAGQFRTKAFSASSLGFNEAPMTAYTYTNKAVRDMLTFLDGKQLGDPQKATDIVVDMVHSEGVAKGRELPLRLPRGSDCLQVMRSKGESILKTCDDWEDVARLTDSESTG